MPLVLSDTFSQTGKKNKGFTIVKKKEKNHKHGLVELATHLAVQKPLGSK